jgi:hypothetical protein
MKLKIITIFSFIPLFSSMYDIPNTAVSNISAYIGDIRWIGHMGNTCKKDNPKIWYSTIVDEGFQKANQSLGALQKLTKETLPEIIQLFRDKGFTDERIGKVMRSFESRNYQILRQKLCDAMKETPGHYGVNPDGYVENCPVSFLIERLIEDSKDLRVNDLYIFQHTLSNLYPKSGMNIFQVVNKAMCDKEVREGNELIKLKLRVAQLEKLESKELEPKLNLSHMIVTMEWFALILLALRYANPDLMADMPVITTSLSLASGQFIAYCLYNINKYKTS